MAELASVLLSWTTQRRIGRCQLDLVTGQTSQISKHTSSIQRSIADAGDERGATRELGCQKLEILILTAPG